mmetsp:Transcript_6714/g.16433  ORF Transcript_6714/g.16433 Transcript_6714/m.16433 type:complete len:200 (-) Transcript_6714:127-726(-)
MMNRSFSNSAEAFFSNAAYSFAAFTSWMEQGPHTTKRRSSSPFKIESTVWRPAMTCSAIFSLCTCSSSKQCGGITGTISLMRISSMFLRQTFSSRAFWFVSSVGFFLTRLGPADFTPTLASIAVSRLRINSSVALLSDMFESLLTPPDSALDTKKARPYVPCRVCECVRRGRWCVNFQGVGEERGGGLCAWVFSRARVL